MNTRVLILTVSRFGRVLLPMVGLVLMLLYCFSIIGMETLHDALSPHYSASLGGACAPYCAHRSFVPIPLPLISL